MSTGNCWHCSAGASSCRSAITDTDADTNTCAAATGRVEEPQRHRPQLGQWIAGAGRTGMRRSTSLDDRARWNSAHIEYRTRVLHGSCFVQRDGDCESGRLCRSIERSSSSDVAQSGLHYDFARSGGTWKNLSWGGSRSGGTPTARICVGHFPVEGDGHELDRCAADRCSTMCWIKCSCPGELCGSVIQYRREHIHSAGGNELYDHCIPSRSWRKGDDVHSAGERQ